MTGPGGGKIFYGTNKYYLEAAPNDQGTGALWGCAGTDTGSDGKEIGTGYANTKSLVENCSDDGIAAKLCWGQNLGNGKTDWFLPSEYELIQLCNSRGLVGGFIEGYVYWSSSANGAYSLDVALFVGFHDNCAANYSGKDKPKHVPCVRLGP
jgi:hypothetical protein